MKKDIKVKKIGNHYFYKSFNILNQRTLNLLLKECEELFTYHKDNIEYYPPEATKVITDIVISNKYPALNTYVHELHKHVQVYAKIAKLDGVIKEHSGWVTRITKENYKVNLENYKDFHPLKNLHNHKDIHIGSVFYLKTSSEKYGTIAMLNNNKCYYNKGEENSVLLYNPSLEHSGIYPPPEELNISPRYTIVFDFTIE